MKNILISISSFTIGGAEKQAIEDANMLSDSYNVFMLGFNEGPMQSLLSKGVKLIIIPKSNYIKLISEINKVISKYKIDLLHAHLYSPMIVLGIAGKLKGIPVIWNFHSHAYENSFKAKIIHKCVGKLSSVKKILFPAKELVSYYKEMKYSFNNKKIEIVYNSGQFQDIKKSVDEKVDKTIIIGYVGRLVELKRVEYLIELAEYLRLNNINNFRVEIVGDGDKALELKSLVNEKDLNQYVVFQGFQSNTLPFFERFDIFTLPSREEVLSLSLIDAGLIGTPSVAFRVGGNGDIIEDGVTGFLVDTKKEFIMNVKELMTDNMLRRTMSDNAHIICNSKFSPDIRKNKIVNLYEQFL